MATKIAVGFFGLDRHPATCHPTILEHVVRPARAFGEVTLVGHFNVPLWIDNPHGSEHSVAFGAQASLLGLDVVWNEKQAATAPAWMEFIAEYPFLNQADPGAVMRRNALWQLWSLQRLWSLLQLAAHDADIVILSRPDLLFRDTVDVADAARLIDAGTEIVTPDWHQHGGRNDRFAVCSLHGAEIYCHRLVTAMAYCRLHGHFHPESVLKFAIGSARLSEGFIATRFNRVRATGTVVPERFM